MSHNMCVRSVKELSVCELRGTFLAVFKKFLKSKLFYYFFFVS